MNTFRHSAPSFGASTGFIPAAASARTWEWQGLPRTAGASARTWEWQGCPRGGELQR